VTCPYSRDFRGEKVGVRFGGGGRVVTGKSLSLHLTFVGRLATPTSKGGGLWRNNTGGGVDHSFFVMMGNALRSCYSLWGKKNKEREIKAATSKTEKVKSRAGKKGGLNTSCHTAGEKKGIRNTHLERKVRGIRGRRKEKTKSGQVGIKTDWDYLVRGQQTGENRGVWEWEKGQEKVGSL